MHGNRTTKVRSDSDLSTVSSDDEAGCPRFLQIVNDMRARIAAGVLEPHAALPSERGIAERYQVSRMTARRASEGLVYSENRRGRFVSLRRLNYDVSRMVSFLADTQGKGSDLEIEVICVRETEADAKLAGRLEQPSSVAVCEYTRLFRANDHPIFMETEYVVAQQFPGFLCDDLHQSTTRILEEEYGTSARMGDIVIRMRGVQAEEARLLGLKISHAVVELEQVICDDSGTPFCFGRQLWRGELAEFSARAIVSPKAGR